MNLTSSNYIFIYSLDPLALQLGSGFFFIGAACGQTKCEFRRTLGDDFGNEVQSLRAFPPTSADSRGFTGGRGIDWPEEDIDVGPSSHFGIKPFREAVDADTFTRRPFHYGDEYEVIS